LSHKEKLVVQGRVNFCILRSFVSSEKYFFSRNEQADEEPDEHLLRLPVVGVGCVASPRHEDLLGHPELARVPPEPHQRQRGVVVVHNGVSGQRLRRISEGGC